MKSCHNITIRVLIKENEDKERAMTALTALVPLDLEKEKIKVQETKAIAADDSIILIEELKISKDRQINHFIKTLASKLSPEQKAMLLRQENRLDEQGNYYIRLDKPKLLDGIYRITDSGNCYHIRFCLAAYPKTRDACLKIIKTLF